MPDALRDRYVVGVVTGPFYRQQVMAKMAERADENGRYETLHQQKFSALRFFLFNHRVPDSHQALCIAGLHAGETWILSVVRPSHCQRPRHLLARVGPFAGGGVRY
jgi:hypothetical protein